MPGCRTEQRVADSSIRRRCDGGRSSQLQRLKHADLGIPEERDEVYQLLAAVEGFMHLAVNVAWALAPDEKRDQLREG